MTFVLSLRSAILGCMGKRETYPQPIIKRVKVTFTKEKIVGWRHRCAHCGEVFESQRKSARYCSAACRQGAFRDRRG